MQNTEHSSDISQTALSFSAIERNAKDWLCDCQYRQHSSRTTDARRLILDKLLWFLDKLLWFLSENNHAEWGLAELRQFLVYLATSHESEAGRWNNPHKRKAIRPRTLHTWHSHLRTFFSWMVKEGVLASSPMDRIDPPVYRSDQIQPFSNEQIETMLRAARKSHHPRRDEAIILLLLDTGLRASELCSLRVNAVDMDERRLTVVGKGNKRRTVYFGRRSARALGQFMREHSWGPEQAVFCSDRGILAGSALTRSGLLQLIERLGKVAAVQNTRCSPHTFQHTFAL